MSIWQRWVVASHDFFSAHFLLMKPQHHMALAWYGYGKGLSQPSFPTPPPSLPSPHGLSIGPYHIFNPNIGAYYSPSNFAYKCTPTCFDQLALFPPIFQAISGNLLIFLGTMPSTSRESSDNLKFGGKSKKIFRESAGVRECKRVSENSLGIFRVSGQWTGSLWVDSDFYPSFHIWFGGFLCSFGWCLSSLT